jgi:hypothetical protein
MPTLPNRVWRTVPNARVLLRINVPQTLDTGNDQISTQFNSPSMMTFARKAVSFQQQTASVLRR